MESSPREDGGQFYQALGDLKFPYTSGKWLSKIWGKIFHTHTFFGGGQRTKLAKFCLLIPS